jgi:hypothetical protein
MRNLGRASRGVACAHGVSRSLSTIKQDFALGERASLDAQTDAHIYAPVLSPA